MVVIGAEVMGLYALNGYASWAFAFGSTRRPMGSAAHWYWNRYPECRFDMLSQVYSHPFSEELLQEWDWKETFSAQPDVEHYLNLVAEKFDLRRDIRLCFLTTSLIFDDEKHRWSVGLADGRRSTAGDPCPPRSDRR